MVSLEETGCHCTKLSCQIDMSSEVEKSYLARCVGLEELCISVTPEYWSEFKTTILSKLKSLRILFLTKNHFAGREKDLAVEIFRENRNWVARDKDQRVHLSYFGVEDHIYECVRLPISPNEDDVVDIKDVGVNGDNGHGYHVSKLSKVEAYAFASVASTYEQII